MTSGMSASDCHNYQRFIGTLDDAIVQQQGVLQQADENLNKGRLYYQQEKRKLNSLRRAGATRAARRSAIAESRREQRLNDEYSARLVQRQAGMRLSDIPQEAQDERSPAPARHRPSAPVSPADAFGAKSSVSDNKGPSFSEVLAQQRPTQSNDARPAGNGAKEPAPGKTGGQPEGHAETPRPAPSTKPSRRPPRPRPARWRSPPRNSPCRKPCCREALEIAAQAAEQVQNARGAAQAAITAASDAVLVNALNANEVTPTRARLPLTAQQPRPPPPRARDASWPCPWSPPPPSRQPARRRDRRHQSTSRPRQTPRHRAPTPRCRARRRAPPSNRASVAGRGSTTRAPGESAPLPAATPTFPAAPARRRRAGPSGAIAGRRGPAPAATARVQPRRHRSAAGRAAGRHARRRHALGRRPDNNWW